MTDSAVVQQETVDGRVYRYLTGFGNELQSECLPDTLPKRGNTPRQVPYGLYTEQLSGTAFTAPRCTNQRTWLYRIQPSVANNLSSNISLDQTITESAALPTQECIDALRWKPYLEHTSNSFLESCQLMCSAGDATHGLFIYVYGTFASSATTCHCNHDGHVLIVPWKGTLHITTELGRLAVSPKEIAMIPRGVVYSIQYHEHEDSVGGYVLEVCGTSTFQLPELGPIGSNGLANARDVWYPVAWCVSNRSEYNSADYRMVSKRSGHFYERPLSHSPYNVVAWRGTYLPFKYNLEQFCVVNSVNFDHLDPSIYTVLTVPSSVEGTALCDFVIFPPRILATDSNTLRPPWFHRNCMSEFMGLIYGRYDAKDEFVPGGASLHSVFTPHGPDAVSYQAAVEDPCEAPTKFDAGLAFMFETYLPLKVSEPALRNPEWRDMAYTQCWGGLDDTFTGWNLLQTKREQQHQTIDSKDK